MLADIATAQETGEAIGFWHATILGIVEGLTEFLPVSSTGHLIVTNRWLGHADPAFEVAIQAGAITAIVFLYWGRLWSAVQQLFVRREEASAAESPRVNLLWLILIAAIPAAVVGLLFEDRIEELLFHPVTVGVALIVGGIGFLIVERIYERRQERSPTVAGAEVAQMSIRQAITIGIWQILALIPGTSRSGATIVGGMLSGCSRPASAEFSFLVGLPILYGACILKIAKDFERLTGPLLPDLLIGSAVAFVTAAIVVAAFVRFLRRYTFRPFAWYRIAAGILILAFAG